MESPTFKVVQLKPGDWKLYKDIYLTSMREAPTAFPNSYAESVRLTEKQWRVKLFDERTMFFAKDGDKLIGMLGVGYVLKKKRLHCVNLISFFVRGSYQGQGVGKLLMDTVLRFLKTKKSIMKVESTVYVSQKASLSIHETSGFAMVGILHKNLKIGKKFYDKYVFEKFIR